TAQSSIRRSSKCRSSRGSSGENPRVCFPPLSGGPGVDAPRLSSRHGASLGLYRAGRRICFSGLVSELACLLPAHPRIVPGVAFPDALAGSSPMEEPSKSEGAEADFSRARWPRSHAHRAVYGRREDAEPLASKGTGVLSPPPYHLPVVVSSRLV